MVQQVEMTIHVAPVVDRWHATAQNLQKKQELVEAYRTLLKTYRPGFWGSLQSRYYSRQLHRLTGKVERLQVNLKRIEFEKKPMSGSAFVTFEDKQYRDIFLKD